MGTYIKTGVPFSLLCLAILGCGQRGASVEPAIGVITQPGTFHLSALDANLIVSIEGDGLVSYKVAEKGGKILFHSQKASAYQRWGLYWEDATSRLWFSSSDIGTSVWRRDEAGNYKQLDVVDHLELIKEMPAKLFDHLPKSLQRRWAKHRK